MTEQRQYVHRWKTTLILILFPNDDPGILEEIDDLVFICEGIECIEGLFPNMVSRLLTLCPTPSWYAIPRVIREQCMHFF